MARRFSPRVRFNPETVETSFGGTQLPGHIKESSVLSDDSRLSIDSFIVSKKEKYKTQSPKAKTSRSLDGPSPFKTPNLKDSEHKFITPTKTLLQHSEQSKFRTPAKKRSADILKQTSQTPDCFNTVTIETPQSTQRHQQSDELLTSEDCGITVAVRVRPFNAREKDDPETRCVVSMVDNETIVTTEKGDIHRFAYDYSFWSFDEKSYDFAGQEHVYQSLAQPMLGTMFEGYNTCLFAYGQTGSGKSYSIMGHNKEIGIIPRFCEELFGRVTLEKREVNVEISYFEIYNEKIHDLLAPSTKDKTGRKTNLKVREHPTMGPYVEELSSYVVESFEDINGWLNVGNKHRATAATWMNDKSSRSHSVFTMILTQTKTDLLDGKAHIHTITSKINLVDLAGSERQSLAKTSGDRLREGASINKSLMTLGKVISLLCEYSTNSSSKKKKLFIPYRDSVLTWLLKESLGGNSKTAMLATISPANIHIEETLSTLRYAQQARYIINTARVNEDPKARLIRELRAEIDKLRSQGGLEDGNVIQASSAEIETLRQKLAAKEKEMAEKERSWRDRLKKSEEQKKEESRLLERLGIAFKVDNDQPNLVNLNEDPQLCEMLLYMLKEGQTKVGREGTRSDIDIQLFGPLIADEHCIFNYDHSKVTVTPLGDALTYVNGNQITRKTVLHHNDRVILGGDHYFRFSHPSEVKGQRKSQVSGAPMDFEFARQELIRVQDARLEAELEQARKKHQSELEKELARKEWEAQQRMEEELTRSKQEADEKLRAQRKEYESKLSEKERLVRDHRKKQFESEQQRQEAEEAIKKLQEQIMVLEQEVLANRKCVEMETKAAQEAMKVSHVSHSEIVEYLEKENQQIQQQIKELTARRQQKREARVNLPRDTPRSSSSYDCSKKDLFKLTLKIQEANKLSQHMNKCTVFGREEVIIDNVPQTLIKVTRTKLDISTLWTVEKFENRLAQMRELYQLTYSDDSTCEVEDIFYDPNDTWEKGVKLNTPNGVSPRVLRGLRRQASNNTPTRVLFDSLSTPTSRGSRHTSSQASPDSVAESASPGTDSVITDSEMADVQPTIGEMCQKQITDTLNMYRGSYSQQVPVDKMLSQCNIVSHGVHLLQDTYNNWRENKQDHDSVYKLKQVLHSQPLMLNISVHVILASVELWSAQLNQFNSSHANQLYEQLVATVRRLANQLVLFLQGCENDLDSMVKESSEKMFSALYLACRLAGEIAMATETPLSALQDAPDSSSILDDHNKSTLSNEIKHAVLSGCEVFVDRTLSLSINTAEECRRRIIVLADDILPRATLTEEMHKQIEVIVSASCDILSKLQQSQIRSQRRQLSADVCAQNYHHRIYVHNENLVTNIVNLTDMVSLLVQVSEPLVKDKDDISLHRIIKCIEMICSTSDKIISLSGGSSCNSMSMDSQLESSDLSMLTDSQLERLDAASQCIRHALSCLERLIHNSSFTEVDESGDFGISHSASPKSDSGASEGLISTGGIVKRNRAIFEH